MMHMCCMKPISLRNIPPEVDKTIQAKAHEKKISVKRAIIELPEECVGPVKKRRKTVHDDLDELVGGWSAREAKAFRQVVGIARQIDKELWR